MRVPEHRGQGAVTPKQVVGVERAVGIDLGLKESLTTSGGHKEEAQRFYRDLAPALVVAQRANKKDRARAIHAKIRA